jgi:hypothetical protein
MFKDNTTSNYDLIKLFKKNKTPLNGVYCKDEIDSIYLKNGFYIVNLANSNKSGTHWCVLLIMKNFKYWMDSYGMPPPEVIKKLKVKYNNKEIQDINSTSCGQFCCLFCFYVFEKLKEGLKINDIIKNFFKLFDNLDYKGNEKKLFEYLKI